jgi:Na+/melibiose symporter-like transporter
MAGYAQQHHIEQSWRYLFCIGLLPALLSLIIRVSIKEPEKWVKARESGERPDLSQLAVPGIRRNTILACFLSAVPIIGTWGVFQWNPTWIGGLVKGDPTKVAIATIVMSVGATIGSFAAGPIAEWIGRKLSYAIFCVTSLVSCLVLYRVVDGYGVLMLVMLGIAGVCTTTFFGWLPLYLPELFPTRIRATGEGITFNFGRILAALMICFGTGQLVAAFGGDFANATAMMSLVYVVGLILIGFAPETRGKKLPD